MTLEKRLVAHEALTRRRIDHLIAWSDDALATTRQNIESRLLEDRQRTQRQLDEVTRELRATAAAANEAVSDVSDRVAGQAHAAVSFR